MEDNYNLLYHGSNISIDQIDLSKCKDYKDFGKAFYLTSDSEQAEHIVQARTSIFGGEPIINTYEFDEAILKRDDLQHIHFSSYTEEWARFVFDNRDEKKSHPTHTTTTLYMDLSPTIE